MEVSINGGTPKWLVYKGKSQSKMDENWGYPHDSGNLHLWGDYNDPTVESPQNQPG